MCVCGKVLCVCVFVGRVLGGVVCSVKAKKRGMCCSRPTLKLQMGKIDDECGLGGEHGKDSPGELRNMSCLIFSINIRSHYIFRSRQELIV